MNAKELPGFSEVLSSHKLGNDRIWSRPLSQISETEVQLFYARSTGRRTEAADLIAALQSELLANAVRGTVRGDELRLVAHEPPNPRYAVDEFIDKLVCFSRPRRQAILLALVTKTPLSKVAALEWQALPSESQVDGLAREILQERSKLRHLRLPYVFWEYVTEKIAAPLIKLEKEAEKVFGMPWPAIQMTWTDMIWISSRSEKFGLLSVLDEVQSGKL